jgi:hypothetical protein
MAHDSNATDDAGYRGARALMLREMSALVLVRGQAIARTFYTHLFDRHPRFAGLFAADDTPRRDARLASILRVVLLQAHHQHAHGLMSQSNNCCREGVRSADNDHRDFVCALAEILAGFQSTLPFSVGRNLWLNELQEIPDIISIAANS